MKKKLLGPEIRKQKTEEIKRSTRPSIIALLDKKSEIANERDQMQSAAASGR